MGAKTPVSILQEMMARLGTPPKYDLIFDGSGTHTTLFKYRVYADSVTAIGTGRSKKEAKHEAARLALERIATHQITDVHPPGEPPEQIEVITPYKDKLQENAIGALHDMCATYEIPMPEYQLIEEEGAPHDKIFTFVCSVSKQREIGIGRTKKQAKQLAAYNMMNRLKESLSDVLTDMQSDQPEPSGLPNIENAVAKYVAAVGTPRKKIRLNRSPCKYHNFFAETSKEIQLCAWEVLSPMDVPLISLENSEADWMENLNQVLESLDAQITIVPGRKTEAGNETVFLQVFLPTEAVFFGSGDSFDAAVRDAAHNSLIFLKIQLRNTKC